MATAQTFIEAALRKIGIKSAETPLSTSELDDGLEALNDMGNQLAAEGYELGFTELSVVGDTVTIPSYANEFYKVQLAARLSADYPEAELSAGLIESLKAAKRAVIRELNRKAVGTSGTYQNLIYGAFELSGVKAGGEPISTVELQNALPRLNDLITELESRGFRLSYEINTSFDLTKAHGMPDWTFSWIKAELAIRLSSSYSIPPNEVCMRMASTGEAAAYARMGHNITTSYPSTLPTGSSNGLYNFYDNEGGNSLETDTGNTISTNDGYTLEYDE